MVFVLSCNVVLSGTEQYMVLYFELLWAFYATTLWNLQYLNSNLIRFYSVVERYIQKHVGKSYFANKHKKSPNIDYKMKVVSSLCYKRMAFPADTERWKHNSQKISSDVEWTQRRPQVIMETHNRAVQPSNIVSSVLL